LAERFKKTYISAREFVNSWEKEIYELNNLDYFIFLIMNDLGSLIEREFFSKSERKEDLFLSSTEIGNLVFNLGDGLQMFFEKNCFGSCELRCPTHLSEHLNHDDQKVRKGIINEFDRKPTSCRTKEQCLNIDLMNYVVLDTLIDFYNYEMRIILDETDIRLLTLADYIMNIITDFTRTKGQLLLNTPQENAGDLFKDSLKNDESPWSESSPELDEDEEEDIELWKTGKSGIKAILNSYRNQIESEYSAGELSLIDRFEEYIADFLEVKDIGEIGLEDLEEFFLVVLINELADKDELEVSKTWKMFDHLFNFIEFQYEFELKKLFDHCGIEENDFHRVLEINRKYQKEYPLVDFLLSSESQNETQIEGFFEVSEVIGSYLVLRDVHLDTYFNPVDMSSLSGRKIKLGDILHLQLVVCDPGWKISHLEIIYPSQSKPYLF